MMLTLHSFFSVVLGESIVMVNDDGSRSVNSPPEIRRTSFGYRNIVSIIISRLINTGVKTRKSKQLIRRTKKRYFTYLTNDNCPRNITDTGNRQNDRTVFIHNLFDFNIVNLNLLLLKSDYSMHSLISISCT